LLGQPYQHAFLRIGNIEKINQSFNIEKRREEQDMAFVHKLALGGQLDKIFEVADSHDRPRTRQTEGEYRLIQKFARTDPWKYSFAVRVVDPWNRLPDDLKLANSKEHFKAKMKRLKM